MFQKPQLKPVLVMVSTAGIDIGVGYEFSQIPIVRLTTVEVYFYRIIVAESDFLLVPMADAVEVSDITEVDYDVGLEVCNKLHNQIVSSLVVNREMDVGEYYPRLNTGVAKAPRMVFSVVIVLASFHTPPILSLSVATPTACVTTVSP
jgi:hypothetical protein